MPPSMDDLLRKTDAAAKAQTEMELAKEKEKARRSDITKRGNQAFQQILNLVRPVIEEFNSRSTSGTIGIHLSGTLKCEFTMPVSGSTMILNGVIDTSPKSKEIKGKVCTFMATLQAGNDRGVHFLLLEDKAVPTQNEWVVVRARTHPLATNARHMSEPFITSLEEIARGTTATAVIDPVYATDIKDAVVEVLGYSL